jgi:hypothetical protein
MVHEHVVAGIATALRAGALTADAVALEARKWGEADQAAEPLPTTTESRAAHWTVERR